MRLTTTRLIWQASFLLFFFYLVYNTAAGATRLVTLGISASFFLEVDPLIALATLASTGQIYHVGLVGLMWALFVFVSAVVFGRAFCSWVCPFGSAHDFFSRLFRPKKLKERIAQSNFSAYNSFKYLVLCAFLGAALLGTSQVGLLDPICLFHRSISTSVFPLFETILRAVTPEGTVWLYPSAIPLYWFGWVIGLIVMGLFLANAARPRFFCRYLCPLGALLGLFSRFSLFRIVRDENKCTDCGLCRSVCPTAAEPDKKLRQSECITCFKCIYACPHGALSYSFLPSEANAVPWPEFKQRRALLGALAGAAFAPLARLSGRTTKSFSPKLIRPPGAVEELEFLKRCVKCGQCMRICPSNVLQPALLEGGVEGLWTPVLKMSYGACDKDCTLCSQVCPTGALQPISPAQRNGEKPFPGRKEPVKVKLGTAFYDRGRCLPWAMNTPCVVCEEVCPVSPKAITTDEVTVTAEEGSEVTLNRPRIKPELCIGCGTCEHACPVADKPAVRVSSVGETRSRGWGDRDRGLILKE